MAQMVSGKPGFTGKLTIAMRKPTPLNRRIDYRAGVTSSQGRKTVCWGKSWDGDTLLAEAEILFVSPKEPRITR
jgi:hypothetical protein